MNTIITLQRYFRKKSRAFFPFPRQRYNTPVGLNEIEDYQGLGGNMNMHW